METLTVGERIAVLRKRRGLKQRELAAMVKMAQADLWRLENNHTKNPHWLRMVAFADALDVNLDTLAGRGALNEWL